VLTKDDFDEEDESQVRVIAGVVFGLRPLMDLSLGNYAL
jgi:hypothetical protein